MGQATQQIDNFERQKDMEKEDQIVQVHTEMASMINNINLKELDFMLGSKKIKRNHTLQGINRDKPERGAGPTKRDIRLNINVTN